MGSSFQMPEFNFRLRRALDPFGSQESGRKFGGVSFWNPQQEDTQEELPPFSSAMPDYSQFYDDSGPAQERYKSYLDKVPQPNDYAPTKWRRLGAVLSGVSDALGGRNGYETARNIVRDPYETAYGDWARGGQGLKEAATMEEAAASKKATIYQKILSDYMDQQRWERDFEVRWANAKTAAERNDLMREANNMTNQWRNRTAAATEARDKSNAAYQQSMLDNAATANNLRRYGIDTQKYGIETGRYTAQKQRELAERQGETGPISGSNQLDAKQVATDQMFQEMSNDPEYAEDINKYFILNEFGAPIMTKTTLPGKYAAKFQNAVNQSLYFSGRR